jgi:hypothetical protein
MEDNMKDQVGRMWRDAVLSGHLSEGPAENQENQSGEMTSWPRFEPSICRIEDKDITAARLLGEVRGGGERVGGIGCIVNEFIIW